MRFPQSAPLHNLLYSLSFERLHPMSIDLQPVLNILSVNLTIHVKQRFITEQHTLLWRGCFYPNYVQSTFFLYQGIHIQAAMKQ